MRPCQIRDHDVNFVFAREKLTDLRFILARTLFSLRSIENEDFPVQERDRLVVAWVGQQRTRLALPAQLWE